MTFWEWGGQYSYEEIIKKPLQNPTCPRLGLVIGGGFIGFRV